MYLRAMTCSFYLDVHCTPNSAIVTSERRRVVGAFQIEHLLQYSISALTVASSLNISDMLERAVYEKASKKVTAGQELSK